MCQSVFGRALYQFDRESVICDFLSVPGGEGRQLWIGEIPSSTNRSSLTSSADRFRKPRPLDVLALSQLVKRQKVSG